MVLTPSQLEIEYEKKLIQIGLNVSESLYKEIQEALYIIANGRGTLIIEK